MTKTHKRRLHMTLTTMALVTLAVVAVMSYVLWFAYHSAHIADTSLKSANKVSSSIPQQAYVSTYAGCIASSGSKVLQTYPEQCVTVLGKKFTSNTNYLQVKEWGVSFAIPSELKTMDYTLSGSDTIRLDSSDLAQLAGGVQLCDSGEGYLGAILRKTTSTPPEVGPQTSSAHVGRYYYFYYGPQQACLPANVASTISPSGQDKYPSLVLQSKVINQLPQDLSQTMQAAD